MTKLETYAKEQVSTLLPKFDCLKLRATVSDTGYSVEFFVTIGKEEKQCYELVDDGIIDENALEQVLSSIAVFIRKSDGYKTGVVNEVSF